MAMWEQILAEEGLSMEAMEEEEKPADMGDMSVREWMAATADDSAKVQAKADQAPPDKKEPEPEPEPEPANLSEEDDGMAMWEQILAEEGLSMEAMEEEEKPADMGDMSVREWMASTSDESAKVQAKADQAPPDKKEPELELEPGTVSEMPPVSQDDGLVLEDELPDWLRDDSVGEEEESASLSWLADETTYEEAEAEAEVEAEAVQPEPEPVVAQDDGLVLEDELPDWLRDDSVGEEEESASLSWLADETTYEEAEAEAGSGKPKRFNQSQSQW